MIITSPNRHNAQALGLRRRPPRRKLSPRPLQEATSGIERWLQELGLLSDTSKQPPPCKIRSREAIIADQAQETSYPIKTSLDLLGSIRTRPPSLRIPNSTSRRISGNKPAQAFGQNDVILTVNAMFCGEANLGQGEPL